MPWFPVDDAFHSHPKAARAGDEALGLWARAGAFCMAYLTDGFVPERWVKQQPKGLAKARRLVEAQLWRVGEKDGEDGFWFHDWKPWCTKAHVLDVRQKARERKEKSRESQCSSRVTDGVRHTERLVHTKPNQTNNSLVDLGGGVTQVGADGPRPECPDHEENYDGPCRKCKRRREWDEKHAALAETDELERKRAARAAAAKAEADCTLCDEGWVIGPDKKPVEPALRCKHGRESAHA